VEILQKEAELQEVVQLVGPDSLQDADRLILEVSRMLRDGFLQQNATSEADASCPLEKQAGMLSLLLEFRTLAAAALATRVSLERVLSIPERDELIRMRDIPAADFAAKADATRERMRASFAALGKQREGAVT